MRSVYLLQSESHFYQRHVGAAFDLRQRLVEHNVGKSPHTSKCVPWKLVTHIAFSDERKAETFERYLKTGSGHAFARKRLWQELHPNKLGIIEMTRLRRIHLPPQAMALVKAEPALVERVGCGHRDSGGGSAPDAKPTVDLRSLEPCAIPAPQGTHEGFHDDGIWREQMAQLAGVRVLFIAGFGPIVRNAAASRKLYSQDLNIEFKEETGGYLHTEALEGVNTFALWPLSQAAQSCFGADTWPSEISEPQAWLEFDVESVEIATTELESRGYRVLVRNKKEPWGQIVSRFLSPEGLLVGITFTPWMRDESR
jgi:predicted GIY-YIG superfamily endonuclease